VTCIVKLNVPVVVGSPEMNPVVVFKLNPGGKLPTEIAQVYGKVPPDARSVDPYGVPTEAFGSEVVVMLSPEMTMLRDCVAVNCGDEESMTLMVKA
jgi:hypothetical protein